MLQQCKERCQQYPECMGVQLMTGYSPGCGLIVDPGTVLSVAGAELRCDGSGYAFPRANLRDRSPLPHSRGVRSSRPLQRLGIIATSDSDGTSPSASQTAPRLSLVRFTCMERYHSTQ